MSKKEMPRQIAKITSTVVVELLITNTDETKGFENALRTHLHRLGGNSVCN